MCVIHEPSRFFRSWFWILFAISGLWFIGVSYSALFVLVMWLFACYCGFCLYLSGLWMWTLPVFILSVKLNFTAPAFSALHYLTGNLHTCYLRQIIMLLSLKVTLCCDNDNLKLSLSDSCSTQRIKQVFFHCLQSCSLFKGCFVRTDHTRVLHPALTHTHTHAHKHYSLFQVNVSKCLRAAWPYALDEE